eukprot:TRINITY_DN22855_c0_g1_i1.p1 TRINITY_DN22855_c0_g1~~TRINITY_DN22855_c0_g1_i1.p1  ORF type:complete len:718 (+),score=131.30 TRINITY_DN22855_c0_g1_i1:43-2196(+)
MQGKEAQKQMLLTVLDKTGRPLSEVGPAIKALLQNTSKTLEEIYPALENCGWDFQKAEAVLLAPSEEQSVQHDSMRSAWEQASMESTAPKPPVQHLSSASTSSSLPGVPPPPVMMKAALPQQIPQQQVEADSRSVHSFVSESESCGPAPAAPEPEPTLTAMPVSETSQATVPPPSFMDAGKDSYPAPSFKRVSSLVGTPAVTPLAAHTSTPVAQEKRAPSIPMTTLQEEIKDKQREMVVRKAGVENQLHKERMDGLENELRQLKAAREERAKQVEDREKEGSRIQHKAAAATMEWKKAFSSISPHLTQMSEKDFTPESVGRAWKKATDASTVALEEKIKTELQEDLLLSEKRDREEERKGWAKRLDALVEQRADDLKDQEATFSKILEQKGQEQTALIHVFHSRLTQVQEAYEARLELSNAETERLVTEHLVSPPRRHGTPGSIQLTPTPTTQLREGARGPIISPMTATSTAGMLDYLDIGGDPLGYSDSEVERQAEAAARHLEKLGKKNMSPADKAARKMRKTRKKDSAPSTAASTPAGAHIPAPAAPVPIDVLRKNVQAFAESPVKQHATIAPFPVTSLGLCPYCRLDVPVQSNYCNACGAFIRTDTVPTQPTVPYSPYQQSPYTQDTQQPNIAAPGTDSRYSKRHLEKKLWDANRQEHRQYNADSYARLDPSAQRNATIFTNVPGKGRESPVKRRPGSDFASPNTFYSTGSPYY